MASSWLSVRTIQYVGAVWICVLVCTSACFLRNCPVGGKKRSQIDFYASPTHHRECLRCGPGDNGRCVGPRICCSDSFGCLIDSSDTVVCQRENLIPSACHVRGHKCGHTREGNCVTRGICCTEDRCWLNAECNRRSSFVDDHDRLKFVNAFFRYGRLLEK